MGKEDDYVNLSTVDGVVVAENVPPPTVHLIEVIAPSDLAEGYQFQAEANGQRYLVSVPSGGVKQGQRFAVEAVAVSSAPIVADVVKPDASRSVKGAWKDGLFSCCRYGCCHAHMCLAFWCAPIAVAQVMTRMRLTWAGGPGSVQQVASTFKTVVGIWVLYLVLKQCLAIAVNKYYPEYQEFDPNAYQTFEEMWANAPTDSLYIYYGFNILQLLFGLYLLIVTMRARRAVRQQYEIPEQCCRGCEDCCCSFWCHCCTTMQMMRHTADYDSYPASCCTETGLPSHIHTV